MPTLRHPAFDDVTVEVPDDAAERWQLAGWLSEQSHEPLTGSGEAAKNTQSGLGKSPKGMHQ